MKRNPQNILIIRLSSIGDIILSFPLIRELNNKYPDSNIDYLLGKKYKPLLRPISKYINNIYGFDKADDLCEIKRYRQMIRATNYDWVLDLHNKLRSRLLTTFIGTKVRRIKKYQLKRWLYIKLGLKIYPEVPVYEKYMSTAPIDIDFNEDWYLHDCKQDKIKAKINKDIPFFENDARVVVIFPGARHYTKRWPLTKYYQLVERIKRQTDYKIIIAGDEKDARVLQQKNFCSEDIINVSGKYNLLETMCLVSLCELVISNDSGPMHMGALFHKSQIAIFGNTVTQFGFAPLNDKAILIENNELNCRPCSHIGYESCPKDHFKCMRGISVDEVFIAFKKLTGNL
ncbi:MAG: glycosyltransferase family 9 protein [Candidatus Marinimicrobia bacterium]|nr:glycosyltransferase family 9 protein [Candidatus Neomarinimicrobiota bacterium]